MHFQFFYLNDNFFLFSHWHGHRSVTLILYYAYTSEPRTSLSCRSRRANWQFVATTVSVVRFAATLNFYEVHVNIDGAKVKAALSFLFHAR